MSRVALIARRGNLGKGGEGQEELACCRCTKVVSKARTGNDRGGEGRGGEG